MDMLQIIKDRAAAMRVQSMSPFITEEEKKLLLQQANNFRKVVEIVALEIFNSMETPVFDAVKWHRGERTDTKEFGKKYNRLFETYPGCREKIGIMHGSKVWPREMSSGIPEMSEAQIKQMKVMEKGCQLAKKYQHFGPSIVSPEILQVHLNKLEPEPRVVYPRSDMNMLHVLQRQLRSPSLTSEERESISRRFEEAKAQLQRWKAQLTDEERESIHRRIEETEARMAAQRSARGRSARSGRGNHSGPHISNVPTANLLGLSSSNTPDLLTFPPKPSREEELRGVFNASPPVSWPPLPSPPTLWEERPPTTGGSRKKRKGKKTRGKNRKNKITRKFYH